jgi:Melibiase
MTDSARRFFPFSIVFNLAFWNIRRSRFFLLSTACCLLLVSTAGAADLANKTIRLELGVNSSGLPAITQGVWSATNQLAFTNVDDSDLSAWLPEALIPTDGLKVKPDPWKVSQSDGFIVGEACGSLAGGLKITWVVELSKYNSLFRVHVRLANKGEMSQPVDWFPAWTGTWQAPDGADWIRWWEPLTFNKTEQQLASVDKVKLGSHLQSSDLNIDENSANPYWVVGGKTTRFYFGVEWCGGWALKAQSADSGFEFLVRLPPGETQLVLGPGESVDGPALLVMPTTVTDDTDSRRAWITQQTILANILYQGPRTSFPLTYNHWSSVGFDVDADFLRQQVAAMGPYGFDAFIVDAGWYDQVGSWEPDPSKFIPGEFEEITDSISQSGVKVGIWSCPQFITAKRKNLPPEVDQPPYYEDFIGGYLLDLAGSAFKDRLLSHVTMLRQRYQADWWKYDQTFFTGQSRAGAMKNVLAFQEALLAVREQNPDLVIENCQSGGRMINALTIMTTQATWLRDGSINGLHHARQNVQLSLGALDFMSPWSVYRWTNNLDTMDQDNDELTRLYCRSAMAGTWGISADLSKISDHQQSVILSEIQNYRRLSSIKPACLYELRQAADGADVAGVTFYDARRKRAAVLLYRWDRKGAFDQQVAVDRLRTSSSYQITDADTGIMTTASGEELLGNGVTIQFGADRLSALLFIEPK